MKKLRYREIKYLATVTKAVNDEPGFEPWGRTDSLKSYSCPIISYYTVVINVNLGMSHCLLSFEY